jgi:hypothetical protein
MSEDEVVPGDVAPEDPVTCPIGKAYPVRAPSSRPVGDADVEGSVADPSAAEAAWTPRRDESAMALAIAILILSSLSCE